MPGGSSPSRGRSERFHRRNSYLELPIRYHGASASRSSTTSATVSAPASASVLASRPAAPTGGSSLSGGRTSSLPVGKKRSVASVTTRSRPCALASPCPTSPPAAGSLPPRRLLRRPNRAASGRPRPAAPPASSSAGSSASIDMSTLLGAPARSCEWRWIHSWTLRSRILPRGSKGAAGVDGVERHRLCGRVVKGKKCRGEAQSLRRRGVAPPRMALARDVKPWEGWGAGFRRQQTGRVVEIACSSGDRRRAAEQSRGRGRGP